MGLRQKQQASCWILPVPYDHHRSDQVASQRYKSGRFATAPNLWVPTGEGTCGYTSNWESIKAIIRWNIPGGFKYK
jgi:hypothetical protein